MKINRIILEDYGPIKKFQFEPGNFELIFGTNESGKTAIVEALSYILFKNSYCRYGRPEKIIIELKIAEKIYTLPAKKSPVEILPFEISRLLYVPASESEVYKKENENRFWDSIKMQLSESGGKVTFTKLIAKVRESVGLQPKIDDWKIEKKKLIAEELKRKKEIEEFIDKKNRIEGKERELKKLYEELKFWTKELENIKKSKQYKIYKELKNLYDEYLSATNKISLYELYDERYLEEWHRLIAEREGLRVMKENQEKIKEKIEGLKNRLNELERMERYLNECGFKDYLSNLKPTPPEPTMFYPFLFFLLGFLVLMLSFKFRFTPLIPFLFFLASIISLSIVYYKKMKIKRIELEKNDWLNKGNVLFPNIKELAELKKKIEEVANEQLRVKTSLDVKMEELTKNEGLKDIKEVERGIEDLRQKTGCAEISQLKKKIEEKWALQRKIESVSAQIHGILGIKEAEKWPGLIEKMATEPPQKEYDISNLESVELKVKTLEDKIREIENEIKFFKESTMKQLNITDEWGVFDEYSKLKYDLKDYELKKQAAKKIEEILLSMSNELDISIEDILKGEKSLTEYFKYVTGRYAEVKVVNKDFVAVDKEKKEYCIDKLSTGAMDQLMLCFRFAAVKRLFPEGSFFIFDDAFIFADWNRRKRLVELLKKISNEGYQIIYFTSDNHTKELFEINGAGITVL